MHWISLTFCMVVAAACADEPTTDTFGPNRLGIQQESRLGEYGIVTGAVVVLFGALVAGAVKLRSNGISKTQITRIEDRVRRTDEFLSRGGGLDIILGENRKAMATTHELLGKIHVELRVIARTLDGGDKRG